MINANVQNEPATSYDVELAGQLAAIGIVKGKEFAPDERMKKILTDAAAVGNAAGRALNWRFAAGASRLGLLPRTRTGATCCSRAARSSRPRRRCSRTACSSRFPPTGARHARFAHGLLLRLHARLARA